MSQVSLSHFVNGTPLDGPFPDHAQFAIFGLGCFWGAERRFWQTPGVISTSVGYAGGNTEDASYDEVCSGRTGHAEVVRVVFNPDEIRYGELLRVFWESHDPTQGMGQGNDRGTQYRSVAYFYDETQETELRASLRSYEKNLVAAGHGVITTEIGAVPTYYFAEDYHQQYLAKNPNGYCGLGGTGVSSLPGSTASP